MVTRKALPLSAIWTSTGPKPPASTNTPPYPLSPTPASAKPSENPSSVYSNDLATSPAFDLVDVRDAQTRARRESDASSHGTWDSDDEEDEAREHNTELSQSDHVPEASQQTVSNSGGKDALPPSLRIGPSRPAVSSTVSSTSHGYEDIQSNPWGAEVVRAPLKSSNPYSKSNGFFNDTSQAAWQQQPAVTPPPPPMPMSAPPPPPMHAPPAPPVMPVELPTVTSPTQELQQMSLGDEQFDRSASWDAVEKIPVPQPERDSLAPPSEVSSDRPDSAWWQEPASTPFLENAYLPRKQSPFQPEYEPPLGPPPPAKVAALVDTQEGGNGKAAMPVDIPLQLSSRQAPATVKPAQPPAPQLQNQRNTTYQIRHINWQDDSQSQNAASKSRSTMRTSPVLTQNANGPCPLLALVNALVLSTPANTPSSLTQILSDREQISLGLLLDAVFDEMTSERRIAGVTEHLPDVSELYAFLLALHTGMNVNPRFVTPATTPRGSWDGVPAALNGAHPARKAQFKAGAFEETREMRLYSTFAIPLIHGWIPEVGSEVHEAFARSAPTFEEAQNLQFAEVELQEKFARGEVITSQEAEILEDCASIKAFLSAWPTQLTEFGLETMASSLQPGQFAILFRNDHFSTLYKEPQHGALMTLVTDAGYATHDEIVWESLVDVTGAGGEMFSGDFRSVEHGGDARLDAGSSLQNGLTLSGRPASSPSPPPLPGPRPSNLDSSAAVSGSMTAAEQEDHDLALALQLQEEEEERQREDERRRKREQELSEQFLSNETEGSAPQIPPRRSGNSSGNATNSRLGTPGAADSRGARGGVNSNASGGVDINHSRTPSSTTSPTQRPNISIPMTATFVPGSRAPVNRPTDSTAGADAPPTYEQAASDRPYRPSASTAASSSNSQQGNAIAAYDALRRQQSAYAAQSTASLPSFDDAGPASPPYSLSPTASREDRPQGLARTYTEQQRRKHEQARLTRKSQIGFSVPPQRSLVGQGGLAPGHYPGSMQARSAERIRAANAIGGVGAGGVNINRVNSNGAGARAAGPGAAAGSSGAPGVKEVDRDCCVM